MLRARKLIHFLRGNMKEGFESKHINYLKKKAKEMEFQSCRTFFDNYFYTNLQTPHQIIHMYPYKNTLDFYFRNYPALIADIDNEKYLFSYFFSLTPDVKELLVTKKMLILTLFNHKQLKEVLKSKGSQSIMDPGLKLIKGCVNLILGKKDEGVQILLGLLSRPVQLLTGCNYVKERAFWNMLIWSAFNNVSGSGSKSHRQLYSKLKKNERLREEDFYLNDYLSFFNMWLSHKMDFPVEWNDFQWSQLCQYERFLYILAQNYYFLKQYKKCWQILQKFPPNNPFKLFLLLTKLYDEKEYKEVLEKGEKYLEQINKKPEYDMVIQNILKIMEKAMMKTEGKKEEIQDFMQILVENNNINKEEELTFIKPYYLSIPYDAFFQVQEFRSLFQ